MVITILGIDFPSAYAKKILLFYQTWTKTDVFNDDIDRYLAATINLSLILGGNSWHNDNTFSVRLPQPGSTHSLPKSFGQQNIFPCTFPYCNTSLFFIYLFVFIVPSEKIKSKNKLTKSTPQRVDQLIC